MREEYQSQDHGSADAFTPFLAEVLRAHDTHAQFPTTIILRKLVSSNEHREDIEAFAEALRRWWPYVPSKFRPLVTVWVATIEHAMTIPLSPSAVKTLKGMMRHDVKQQIDLLRKADRSVLAAWVKFYPAWVQRLIAERAALDPMLLMSPGELEAAKKARETASDTGRKRALRGRDLAQKFYDYLQARGGTIEWCPVALSRVLSSKAGGPRLKPEKIIDAASALVCIDVARWIKDRDGNKRQLQLVEPRMMLPALETLH